jgi:KipI family sensor histidine kinase inhibitor
MRCRLLPCGDTAVLTEVDGLAQVLALHSVLREAGPRTFPGLLDVVPAAKTLLLVSDDPATLPHIRAAVARVASGITDEEAAASAVRPRARVVEVEVAYDGEDLAEVARLTGLSPHEVAAAHTGTPWTVAFGGFVPGFSYLVGGDPRLQVPRRAEPRTHVPAGSVALAGTYSGIYPRVSPGGWQLIGHTRAPLWDLDRDPPALLQPGDLVRFMDAGPQP